MAELPSSPEGIVLTHFIVSDDVERSRRFYTEILGGTVVFGPEPINVALASGTDSNPMKTDLNPHKAHSSVACAIVFAATSISRRVFPAVG